MERVTFIVSPTQERITCLLNPEHLVQRRRSGLRRPLAGSGPINGTELSDDALLHTGGGHTEFDLDLLFDIALLDEQRQVQDVRQLTKPLWDLTENAQTATDGVRVRPVRMLWGKGLNVLTVVEAVAERLEHFDAGGNPSRSWVSLRLRRITDATPAAIDPQTGDLPSGDELAALASTADTQEVHTAVSPGVGPDGQPHGGERLDELAARYYDGRSWLWRLIAAANNLGDAPWAPHGVTLTVPEPPAQVR